MTRYRITDGLRQVVDGAGQTLGTCAADWRGLTFTPEPDSGLAPIRLAGILPSPSAWATLRRMIVAARHGGTHHHGERKSYPLAAINRRLAGETIR